VCGGKAPIHLVGGTAIVKDSPWPGLPYVHADLDAVRYGDIAGPGPGQAALDIWCDNGGGTADGQLADAWVIFTAAVHGPQVIGVLTPQQPFSPGVHVPYFNDEAGGIVMAPGTVVVHELWYGPGDFTCCPSDRATTTWSYKGGRLQVETTTVTKTALPLPRSLGVPDPPVLSDVVTTGALMALDTATGTGEFFIGCGWDLRSKREIRDRFATVGLRDATFGAETNPVDPARGAVWTVKWSAWQASAKRDGWSGFLYLTAHHPRLTDGPGTDVCHGSF
jgi:hypothetical protein